MLGSLHQAVAEFHRHGLFLYTWGDANNDYASYMAQREAGVGEWVIGGTWRSGRPGWVLCVAFVLLRFWRGCGAETARQKTQCCHHTPSVILTNPHQPNCRCHHHG